MEFEYSLKKYFIRYLTEIRHLKESSVKHYLDALNNISRYLVKQQRIKKSIYEILDLSELEMIKTFLFNDIEFLNLDRKGHQMYSSGFNNYFRFAIGEGFHESTSYSDALDIVILAKDKVMEERSIWQRSSIIKKQSIELAGFICEINSGHETFIAESTKRQFMEGHHAIPMYLQASFECSLDVHANIICICPTCHRLLHYGLKIDKELLLEKMYGQRYIRLAKSGIKLSRTEFLEKVI